MIAHTPVGRVDTIRRSVLQIVGASDPTAGTDLVPLTATVAAAAVNVASAKLDTTSTAEAGVVGRSEIDVGVEGDVGSNSPEDWGSDE